MADATVADLPTLKTASCPAQGCERKIVFYEDGTDIAMLMERDGNKKVGVERTIICPCGEEYTIPSPS